MTMLPSARVQITCEPPRAHLFVATLAHSRQTYVKVFEHQREAAWFTGLEGAFGHCGGVTDEVLVDNPKRLVVRHDAATREVEFTMSGSWRSRRTGNSDRGRAHRTGRGPEVS